MFRIARPTGIQLESLEKKTNYFINSLPAHMISNTCLLRCWTIKSHAIEVSLIRPNMLYLTGNGLY